MKQLGKKANVSVLSLVIFSILFTLPLTLPQQAAGEENLLLGVFVAYPGADEMSEASDALLMVFRGISGGSMEGESKARAFATNDPLSKVVNFYRDNPPDQSWEMVMEVGSEEQSYIALWRREDETAQLVVGSDDGETTILMGYGKEGQGEEADKKAQWRAFTEEDGIVSDTARVMVEGKDGTLWIGTSKGLSGYRNSEWENYTELPVPGGVSDIAVAADGTLWIGTTYGGVLRYDGKSWASFREKDGLVNDHVSSVDVGENGDLWVSSYKRKGGLSVYDGVNWTTYTKNDGLPSNYVHSVVVSPLGEVWAGTKGGLAYLSQGTWERVTKKDGLIDNDVEEVSVDGHGDLWAVTDKGVSRYDGTYLTNYPDDEFFPARDVFQTSIGPEGDIWFGTKRGISVFDGKSWRNYTAEDGLPDEYIISLVATSSGEIWLGTIGEGIWVGRLE